MGDLVLGHSASNDDFEKIGTKIEEIHERLGVLMKSASSGSPQGVRSPQQAQILPVLELRPNEYASDHPWLSALVRKLIADRREQANLFDGNLFADPAWDILLDLLGAELARQRATVGSIAEAAKVPHTTAIRWMAKLEKLHLIERRQDPLDGRRIFLSLSVDASTKLRAFLISRYKSK